MSKKAGLGKGLGAIFVENPTPVVAKPEVKEIVEGTPQEVAVKDIVANPYQPRKVFDEEKLQELAASIKEYGVVQPLVVRKKGKKFELVAGERRLRASKLVGLKQVPVVIREYDETEMMEIALIENIQRHDLNPIEEAQGIKRLMEECKLTQEQVAIKVGRSRTAVANILRLLNLAQGVQNLISENKLTMGQAKQIATLRSEEEQISVAQSAVEQGWTARTTEEVVRELLEGKKVKVVREMVKTIFDKPAKEEKKVEKKAEPTADLYHKDFESKLVELLGTKVKVNPKADAKKGGTIEIEYYSPEDLERIYEALQPKVELKPVEVQATRKLHV
ncbi:MAG: ParB/RepB/Spo0J family partition protein [Phascolarctobacterium sp.]|nr:ParB/RepB/Spo0J family partition protein [Phascolarctobacterium sp.]